MRLSALAYVHIETWAWAWPPKLDRSELYVRLPSIAVAHVGSYVKGAILDEPLHVAISYHPPCRAIQTQCRVWAHAHRTHQLDMLAGGGGGGSGGCAHRGSGTSAVACCMCPSTTATNHCSFACLCEVAKTVAVIALWWPTDELDCQ